MKTIIAGSRGITDLKTVESAVALSGFQITEVVSGAARGVDELGEKWAFMRGIPIQRFRAKWDLYGKSAGAIRNNEMAFYAQALVAVWDGSSPGTKHMIERATKMGRKVYVHTI